MKRSYGIAGNGRASAHLQAYFRLLNIPFRLWHRRSGLNPAALLAPCTTVFVLLSDSAIAPFIAAHPFLKNKKLIHFSGSLSIRLHVSSLGTVERVTVIKSDPVPKELLDGLVSRFEHAQLSPALAGSEAVASTLDLVIRYEAGVIPLQGNQ